MGLVDIQATEDRLSLSTEQCYISGEWSIGHALDFGQQQILRIFFSFNFCFFCPELKDVWYLTVIHRESQFYLFFSSSSFSYGKNVIFHSFSFGTVQSHVRNIHLKIS